MDNNIEFNKTPMQESKVLNTITDLRYALYNAVEMNDLREVHSILTNIESKQLDNGVKLKVPRFVVNFKDNVTGNTPFILAVLKNNVSIVQEFLKFKELNINIMNNEGKTALIYAAENNNTEIIELLCKDKRTDVNISGDGVPSAFVTILLNNNMKNLAAFFGDRALEKSKVLLDAALQLLEVEADRVSRNLLVKCAMIIYNDNHCPKDVRQLFSFIILD